VLKDEQVAQQALENTEMLTFGQETSIDNYGMVPRNTNQNFYNNPVVVNPRNVVTANQPYLQVDAKKSTVSNNKQPI